MNKLEESLLSPVEESLLSPVYEYVDPLPPKEWPGVRVSPPEKWASFVPGIGIGVSLGCCCRRVRKIESVTSQKDWLNREEHYNVMLLGRAALTNIKYMIGNLIPTFVGGLTVGFILKGSSTSSGAR